MSSYIIVSGVSFELPNGHLLFKNIHFSLQKNITALVGPNGIGKSCLAQIIADKLVPSDGIVRRNGAVAIFPQREIPQDISVQEYLADRYTWSVLGDQLLDGIHRNQMCSRLSGGEWMRVRLAATVNEQFLILDEPTNDLDRSAKNIIKDFLHDYSFGVLLISHDRELLQLCDEVLELSKKGLKKFGGHWHLYENEKNKERMQLHLDLERAKKNRSKAQEERKNEIVKQEKRSLRGKEFGIKTGMSKIVIQAKKRQAEGTTGKIDASTAKRAEIKVQEAFEAWNEMKLDPLMYADLSGEAVPHQKLIFEARSFNIKFDPNLWLYKNDLDFSWRGNIRLAIKGANGSGKSTLVRALLGSLFQAQGELRRGSLRTLYMDQHCSILNESLSVYENVRAVSQLSESEIRNNLAKLLFTGEKVFQTVQTLSGGERLRAALACGLMKDQKPELLVLDEPTNNLDLANIQFLENLIAQFKGAIIIISHDEVFLKNCGIDSELVL